MLVNAQEILLAAQSGGYAIAAPDFLDLDSARTFVQTADEANQPIILSFAQAHQHVISLKEAAAVGLLVAQSVDVPIALHLDHGQDIDYIKQAIAFGFTSVMIDASMECFADNVRLTREVVDYAHAHNVTVEAEIGHVGQGEQFGNCAEGAEQTTSIYTSAEDAVAFAAATKVDSLAISIGTAHGIYAGSQKPTLNFDRLHEIRSAVDVPLVLHGGSGSGNENLHRCATEGIAKINVFTDFLVGAMKHIEAQQPQDFISLKNASNQGMQKVLQHYFRVFANY